MPFDPLRLRVGVTPQRALAVLREWANEGRNIRAVHGTVAARDAYLVWVETTETQLRGLTLDPAVTGMLQTERYWHIREMHDETPRPQPLLRFEIERQTDNLDELAKGLQHRIDLLCSAPGDIAVIDTNILLHFQLPSEIDWCRVLSCAAVRLVLPIRVIEELDAKKYAASAKLAQRARESLPRLERSLGSAGRPGQLRDDVTIEVPMPPSPRRRPADADEEILDQASELALVAQKPVTVVTGDTSMRLRAQARALDVVALPAAYARRRDDLS